MLDQLQVEGQAQHPVILQGELDGLAEVGTGQHRVTENAVAGYIQALAQQQPQRRLMAGLQGGNGKQVEVEKRYATVGVLQHLGLDPCGGKQRLALNPKGVRQLQQGLDIGQRHQLGGEIKRRFHLVILMNFLAGYDPNIGRR